MILTRWFNTRRPTTSRTGPPVAPPRFRPMMEGMEDRAVPANLLNITDVDLTGLSVLNGVLTATGGTVEGTLAGLPFATDITNLTLQLIPDDPGTTGVECSILSLELAPIDVDLLGLHVDTSAICLDVTATEGGGLLGSLLCGLADGLPLLGNLPILSGLGGLNDVVGDILGAVLGGALTSAGAPAAGAEDICDGECEVLDLALGPVDLSLLGLNVSLDNCEDGPVQVCVSASEGEGLLGDLLCGLAGGGIDLGELTADPLQNLTQKDVDKLVKQGTKLAADGDLSLQDVTKLVDQFERLARR
ncbi:MAG TPA: hypothetical protein VD866_33480 [Urbifossiella sp.]|nr:hypothetical protein [Urbifossiella sp.]